MFAINLAIDEIRWKKRAILLTTGYPQVNVDRSNVHSRQRRTFSSIASGSREAGIINAHLVASINFTIGTQTLPDAPGLGETRFFKNVVWLILSCQCSEIPFLLFTIFRSYDENREAVLRIDIASR